MVYNKISLPDFVVVDDAPINNLICRMVIRKTLPDALVETFTDPEAGLDYIRCKYPDADASVPDTIILLDINMPVIDGWKFLEYIMEFDEQIKQRLSIYILTSSIDARDIQRANNNENVKGYIVKPFNKKSMDVIFSKLARLFN
jgi:CheY-like chemotaxis protein